MKQKKILLFITFVTFFFSLNGCATLFKGTTEEVTFTSTPSSAKVIINGSNLGKTPLKIELKSNQSYSIDFEKEGYENRTILLNNSVSPAYVVLDIVLGVIPVAIDAITGCWFTLDHDHVNVIMEKQKE